MVLPITSSNSGISGSGPTSAIAAILYGLLQNGNLQTATGSSSGDTGTVNSAFAPFTHYYGSPQGGTGQVIGYQTGSGNSPFALPGMSNNTPHYGNSFIGYQTGSGNSPFALPGMSNNTPHYGNSFIGYQTGSGNSPFALPGMSNNTPHYGNSFIGYQTGSGNSPFALPGMPNNINYPGGGSYASYNTGAGTFPFSLPAYTDNSYGYSSSPYADTGAGAFYGYGPSAPAYTATPPSYSPASTPYYPGAEPYPPHVVPFIHRSAVQATPFAYTQPAQLAPAYSNAYASIVNQPYTANVMPFISAAPHAMVSAQPGVYALPVATLPTGSGAAYMTSALTTAMDPWAAPPELLSATPFAHGWVM